MSNEIQDRIKQAKKSGMSDEQVSEQLKSQGYADEDITNLLNKVVKTKKGLESFHLSNRRELRGIGSWLAIFIIGVFLSAAIKILFSVVSYTNWSLINILLGLYGIFVVYKLFWIKSKAITHTYVYLIITLLIGVISLFGFSAYPKELGSGWNFILYSCVWLLYFSISKRVKNTYPN